jgi:hypothetical protein
MKEFDASHVAARKLSYKTDDDDEYFVALFLSVPLSVYLTDLLAFMKHNE